MNIQLQIGQEIDLFEYFKYIAQTKIFSSRGEMADVLDCGFNPSGCVFQSFCLTHVENVMNVIIFGRDGFRIT